MKTTADDEIERPFTAKSLMKSIGDSMSSLRSIFSTNQVQPMDGEVVYGIEEFDTFNKDANKAAISAIKKDENEVLKEHGCFMRFYTKMKNAYETRKIKEKKEDPDLVLKTKLRELFMYILYLILLVIILFGMPTASMYYYTQSLTNNILSYQSGSGGTFATIGAMEDFWQYVTGPLLQSLYWNTWYNQFKNLSLTGKDVIFYEDVLVGLPRLRQLRVKTNSCEVYSLFQNQIMNCYDQYSAGDADITSFGPANDTAWIYAPAVPGTIYPYQGKLATYENGGYIQLLTRNSDSSLNILNYLQENLWLDQNTRVVFVDYTVYNPNIDLFCIIKLVFEFPYTGGAIPFAEIRTTKLLRYVSPFDYFVMLCEILFTIFIFYYILIEVLEMKKFGIQYFIEIWNVIDIFVVIISLSCILLNIYRCYLANASLQSLLDNKEEYINFDFASYWQKIYNEAICINIFCSWVKIYRYIKFSKTLSQLSDTIAISMNDLIGFTIMFLLVFFNFSCFAYLIFSSQLQDYQKLEQAIFALFRIILGDFTFTDFYNVNPILGPIFFITYIFFVFFILLSMFVAIINDSFIEVKERISKFKDDFQIASFLKKQILNRLRKDKIVKIQEVLENGDFFNLEEVTFHNWRSELLKHGYADIEIQALFMKYDQDGDRVLDYDERKRMLQDIKEKRLNLLAPDDEEADEEEDDDPEIIQEQKEFVTQDEMKDLVDRINKVENGLMEIIRKIDKVLQGLAESEQAKLDHQQKIRYTLEVLTCSKPSLRT